MVTLGFSYWHGDILNIKSETVILHFFSLFCHCRLYIIKGKPADVFPRLFKNWGVSHLTFEEDIEPYALTRDSEIKKLADEHNVKVTSCVSHTLFDPKRFVI